MNTTGRGAMLLAALLVAGCGSLSHPADRTPRPPRQLLAQARAIGRGPGFETTPRGPVLGVCRPSLGGRFGVHVEVFARNRVVLVPGGIGTLGPRSVLGGRIVTARCYGELVTLEPTGLLLIRARSRLSARDLFRSWGQPLAARRIGAFPAPGATRVEAFVNGRRWQGPVARIPLRRHDEIVLEVPPFVQPHDRYAFPPGD